MASWRNVFAQIYVVLRTSGWQTTGQFYGKFFARFSKINIINHVWMHVDIHFYALKMYSYMY